MILVNEDLWSKLMSVLSNKISPSTFNIWFKSLKLYRIDQVNIKIIIIVPMPLYKIMFEQKYNPVMIESINEITGMIYDIEYVLEEEVVDSDIVIDNSDIEPQNNTNEDFDSNLNRDFNFDNFIVGDTNKFAKTAAYAVASQPGKIYNPLFIYGKSGLGKTHLMHAIGNYIVENSNLKVLYTTSGDFRDDYINITSANSKEDTFNRANYFKNKYRDIDVLIIDDIQFLVDAKKTQEEFFHIFENLHSQNKQIIISSDRSPDDLKLLEDRLKSRFSWGLPVDIWPPDFDLRCRIIKDKIKKLSFANKMSEEAIEYIATTCDTDVRNLEGAVNRLQAYTAIYLPEVIDVNFAKEALGDLNKNFYSNNSIGAIQSAVASYYELTVEVLKGKKKSKNIAYPRMIAMYLSRMMTDESFPRIGLEFGARDHSTVMHACDKIAEDLKNNKKLQEIINEIKTKV